LLQCDGNAALYTGFTLTFHSDNDLQAFKAKIDSAWRELRYQFPALACSLSSSKESSVDDGNYEWVYESPKNMQDLDNWAKVTIHHCPASTKAALQQVATEARKLLIQQHAAQLFISPDVQAESSLHVFIGMNHAITDAKGIAKVSEIISWYIISVSIG